MYNSVLVLLFSSNTIYIVMSCFILTMVLIANELKLIKLIKKKKNGENDVDKYSVVIDENNNNHSHDIHVGSEMLKEAPGPKPKFIIGNLDALNGYEVPFQAFTTLAEKYGTIIKLRMGSVPAMVINGIENIKEVVVTKGHHFDSRPDFRRYHMLFSGDKNNSIAFCDWSDMQKCRREKMSGHTFPRKFSANFERFSEISMDHLQQLSVDIKSSMEQQNFVAVKPLVGEACANIFLQYFTTRSFDKSDAKFQRIIKNFDLIFWEVNQGYAADFLPFLMPLHRSNMKKMEQWSHEIRQFMLEEVVADRYASWTIGSEPNDYIESLIDHVKQEMEPKMEWDTALFTLEDLVGGYAALSHLVIKVLAFIVKNKEVQKNIQSEVDELLNERSEKSVLFTDRNKLIYTEAVIMESLRVISSPIVPHVANQDSSIDGYSVKAGTLLFLNNYDLNTSPALWDEPEKFEPKRFISNGKLLKPEHFIPFGMGRRSCMGYKLVQLVTFALVGNIMKEFDISSVGDKEIKVPVGSLAMSEDPYQFMFTSRH